MSNVRDVLFALRLFRRRPGFAILGTATLALGIGATTAVYTIVRAVLLRPLPYRDPGRLVLIWDNAPRDGDQVRQILARRLDFEEYRRSARLIESVSLAGRTRPVRGPQPLPGFFTRETRCHAGSGTRRFWIRSALEQ